MTKRLLCYNFNHPLYGPYGKYRWVGRKKKATEFLKEFHKLERFNSYSLTPDENLEKNLQMLKNKDLISMFMDDWPPEHIYLAAYFIDLENQIFEHCYAPTEIYLNWIQSFIYKTFTDGSRYTYDVIELIKFTNFLSLPVERYFSILSILKYLWIFPKYSEKEMISSYTKELTSSEEDYYRDLTLYNTSRSREKDSIMNFCWRLLDLNKEPSIDIDFLKYKEFEGILELIDFLESLLDKTEEQFL